MDLTNLEAQRNKTNSDFNQPAHAEVISIEHQDTGNIEPNKIKKKSKRNVTRPPKGHSCADRILTLRSDGFFKSQKTTSEIVAGLANKGWTHKANQVSAALGPMFNRGDIQRTAAGKGFAYFWDRD